MEEDMEEYSKLSEIEADPQNSKNCSNLSKVHSDTIKLSNIEIAVANGAT